MPQFSSDIMTISEAADYLRIPRSSLYKLAQERKLPCQKVGRHWRFKRDALDRWLEEMPNLPMGENTNDDRKVNEINN